MNPLHLSLALVALLIAGCATQSNAPHAEFVRSVDFTHFDIAKVTVSAAEDPSNVLSEVAWEAVNTSTDAAIRQALTDKGFELVTETDAQNDLRVSANWRARQVESSTATPPLLQLNPSDPDRPLQPPQPSARGGFQLVIEIADAYSGNVFWRSVTPARSALFAPTAESAASNALKLMKPFPNRVEKDPDLPHISLQPNRQ